MASPRMGKQIPGIFLVEDGTMATRDLTNPGLGVVE